MSRIFLSMLAAVFIAVGMSARPARADARSEASELADRIDQRDQRIDALFDYSHRLQEILKAEGLSGEDLLGPRTPAQKMGRSVPAMHFDGIPFDIAMAAVARAAGVNIQFDWKSLQAAGLSHETRISCNTKTTSANAAMAELINAIGGGTDINFFVNENGINVISPSNVPLLIFTRKFDLSAMLSHESDVAAAKENLTRIIVDTVAPDTWQDAGGTVGSISFSGNYLVVTQTPVNLKAINALLEQLDIDREMAADRREINRQQIQLVALDVEIEKLSARIRSTGTRVPPRLDQVIDNVLDDMQFVDAPLSSCIESLRRASDQEISVHWNLIADAQISPRKPISLTLRHCTIIEAVQLLVEKASTDTARLDWVVDGNTIVISTAEDIAKNTITRVYDARDLIIGPGTREEAAERLMKAITSTIDADSWRDAGGTIGSIRELQGQLIITQTERTHKKIKAWLENARKQIRLLKIAGE